MRIALISFEFPPATAFGGIATYSAQAADMLAFAGHQVEVFAGGAIVQTYTRPSGAVVHTLGCMDQIAFALPSAVALLTRHREAAFEIVEAPEYLAAAEYVVRLIPSLPLVLRLHTPSALLARINLPKSKWRLSLRDILKQVKITLSHARSGKTLPSIHLAHEALRNADGIDAREAFCARRSDLLVSPSQALLAYPAKHWSVPAARTRHLPNVYSPPEAILSLPPPTDEPILAFFGRLEVRKGILTIAAALPHIARSVPGVRLLFVGQSTILEGYGDAHAYLSTVCKSLGIEAEFPGRQPHEALPHWYGRARVIMLPSQWENFPYACLETMASARAVIGSSAGGMSDMLPTPDLGLLCEPNNPAALAEIVIRLLKDPDLCRTLGQAARQSVLNRYHPRVLVSDYEDAYRDAIAYRENRLAPAVNAHQ